MRFMKTCLPGFVVCCALGTVPMSPAVATTSATLTPGNGITFGQFTVTITDCNSAYYPPYCGLAEITSLPTNDGIVITGPNGNHVIDSSGSGIEDLSVTFTVIASTTPVTRVGVAVSSLVIGSGATSVDVIAKNIASVVIGSASLLDVSPSKTISLSGAPYGEMSLQTSMQEHSGSINSVTEMFDVAPVPEPSSASLFGLVVAVLAAGTWRRKRLS